MLRASSAAAPSSSTAWAVATCQRRALRTSSTPRSSGSGSGSPGGDGWSATGEPTKQGPPASAATPPVWPSTLGLPKLSIYDEDRQLEEELAERRAKWTRPEKRFERWEPKKKLAREDMQLMREMHDTNAKVYTIDVLAKKFAVSFEAVRRILHSKYDPRVQGRGSTAAALEREKEPTAAEREAAEREERRAMAEATSERHRLQSWSPPLVNSSSPSSTGTGTISPQAQDHAKQLEYSYRLGDMRMKDTLERLRRQEDAEKSKAAADKRLLRLQGQAQEVEHRQPRQQQPQPGQQPRWPRAEQSKRPSQSEQQGQGQQRWWGQQHHQQDEERSGSNDSGNRARLQQDEERSGSNGNDREQKLDDRRRREKYENAPPRKLWWGAEDSQQQPPGDEQRTVARTGSSPRRQQGRPPPQKDEDRRQLEEGTSSRGKPREPPRFALQAKEERSGNKTSAPLRKTSKPLPVKDEDDDEDEDEDEDNRHQLEERRPSLKFTGDISRHKDDELELQDSTGRRVVLNENNSLGDRSGQQRSRPKTEVSLGPMHRNDMFGDNPVTRPKKFMSKLWQEGSSGGTTDAGGAVAGEQQQSPQLRNLAVLNSRDRRRLERGNEPTSKNQHLELVEILPSVLIEMQAAEKAAKEAAEAAGAADPATADTAAKEAA